MKEVEEIVGIPEDQRAFAIFPLGYPAEEESAAGAGLMRAGFILMRRSSVKMFR